jgi:predicted HicB family RNase H-like nuclease
MSASKKKKQISGSLKIDPEVHEKLVKLCDRKGWKINPFASKTISKEVDKIESEEKE